MINCDLTMGWDDRTCATSIGGIKKAIPVPIENLTYSSLVITANEITALTATEGGYEYNLQPNLSSYTAAPSRSEGGSVLTNISLNMVLQNDTKALRSELMALARKTCVWFVLKSDGTWVCLGLLDGLLLQADNEGGSGVAKTDRNGYSLTFTGQEVDEVPDVDEAVVTALTEVVSS